MRISVLQTHHVPAYRQLMLHAYEHAADAFTSTALERANETDDWWARRIADPDGSSVAFGAWQGDALVATVALEFSAKPKTRHKALVIGMYVMEACRGRGVGRALLDAAIGQACSRAEVRVLQLTVTEGNVAAITLYRAAGFEPFGTEPMAILTPGGFKAKVHMWRAIEPTTGRGSETWT